MLWVGVILSTLLAVQQASVMREQGQYPLWTDGSSIVSLTMDVFIRPLLDFETYTSLIPNSNLSGLAGRAPDMLTPCTSLAHWNGLFEDLSYSAFYMSHTGLLLLVICSTLFLSFFPHDDMTKPLNSFEHQFSVFAN